MEATKHLPKSASASLSVALSALLVLSGAPTAAFASSAPSQERAAASVISGTWTLAYHATNDGICVDGVTAVGSGALEIPDTIDGQPVVALGAEAFKGVAALKEVKLPSTLKTMGEAVFMNSGLTRITIPASVLYLPWQCFRGCTSLANVTFEGATMKYLLDQAFYGCTSLTELALPCLTAYPTSAETGVNPSFLARATIGEDCFNGCAKLKRIVFQGPVASTQLTYLASTNCFAQCPVLTDFVCLGQTVSFPMGTSQNAIPVKNMYFTLDFYDSAGGAEKGTGLLGSATYRGAQIGSDGTKSYPIALLALLKNPAQFASYRYSGSAASLPTCPSGKVWGVTGHTVACAETKMAGSYRVAAVERENLDYGWLSSPRLDAANEDRIITPGATNISTVTTTFYRDRAGKVIELDRLKVCAADGSVLDPSKYTLVFEEVTTVNKQSTYKTISASQIKLGGTYRVKARGVGAYAKTETAPATFTVAAYAPEVTDLGDSSQSRRLGLLMARAAEQVEGSQFSVAVSGSHWQDQLVGAALAGTGQGVLLYDCGSDYSNEMTRAFIQTGATALQAVGSTSRLPQSARASSEAYLMDYLRERNLGKASRYSSDGTPQSLADEVYSTIKKGRWGVTWSDTALVVPTKNAGNILTVAQYAYQRQAPVFFANEQGALSSADLGYLKAGRFKKIVIAGTTAQVSASCATAIKSSTGVTPSRFLSQNSNSALNSIAGAKAMLAAGASSAQVVIADGRNAADVTAASVLAGSLNGIVLTCASSADAKQLQVYLQSLIAEKGSTAIENLYFVGNFSSWGSDVRKRVLSLWDKPGATAIAKGDTVEADGLVYKITGTDTVQLVGATTMAASSLTINTVSYAGKTYRVTSVASGALAGATVTSLTLGAQVSSIPATFFKSMTGLRSLSVQNTGVKTIAASQFSGLKNLSSVAYAAKVSSIGSSAFQGCTALKTLNGNVRSATTVGKKAFYGCTALSSVSFPAAKSIGSGAFQGCTALKKAAFSSKLKTVGANAFRGCKKLASVSLGGKVASVGSGAFLNCTALKSVTLGSKLSTLGASAFQGCTKLATVKIPSKSLKKIGAKAFYNCKKLKAITLGTSKLTAKRIGSKAFAKTASKAVVKVPKAKVKAYGKALVKKGLSKKATVKKG